MLAQQLNAYPPAQRWPVVAFPAQQVQREPLKGYPDLLSPKQAAEVLGLNPATVRKMINAGDLPGCRLGSRLFVSKRQLIEQIEGGNYGAQA